MDTKKKDCSSLQEEVLTESNTNTQKHEIKILSLNQLVNFKEYPFKIEINTELFELMQRIEMDGVVWFQPLAFTVSIIL